MRPIRYLWDRFVTLIDAVGALSGNFQEGMVAADPLDLTGWTSYPARMQRYRLLWALYENTAYSGVHPWAAEYRKTYGLYTWTRNVYNPAYRLGEFHATHLMGGDLDPEAGDGSERSTALPVLTDNPAVRTAIAQLWRDSKWQANKTKWCRWGSVKGDVALKIVDDPISRRVVLCPEPPEHVRHVDRDEYGEVQGYLIEYYRPDPEWDWSPDSPTQPQVVYSEICERLDGDNIRFRTLKQGRPYDWRLLYDGTEPDRTEWTKPYGFIPLELVQHIDQGSGWGWAECQPAFSKIRECDDLGSVLTDQARRILNSPWIMNARKPSQSVFNTKPTAEVDEFATGSTTQVRGRDRMTLTWIDPRQNEGRPVQPFQLVGAMPIGDVLAAINLLLGQMAQDFPELAMSGTDSGDSGRARRIPRQQVEAKVHERRTNYDAALVRAQEKALHIGALGRYPGYEGLTAADYKAGNLAHRIDKRPVFAIDPMDEYEEEAAVVTCLQTAANADPSLIPITMRRLGGYTAADIRAVEDSIALAQAAQAAKLLAPQATPGQNPLGPLGGTAVQPPGESRNGQAVGG